MSSFKPILCYDAVSANCNGPMIYAKQTEAKIEYKVRGA